MTLPFVLAGPIVRRTEARTVSVWVALSKPAQVELHVWAGVQTSTGIGTVASGDPAVATGTAGTKRFGEKLHVAVVTARADAAALIPGTIHSYDLSFAPSTEPFANTNLRGLKLLEDEAAGARIEGVDPSAPLHLALGYVPMRLPAFATPAATIPGLRLLHASCRRTNVEGTDALSFVDDQIRDRYTNPDERPQQLFLTGDQIYADDLAACMLPQLNAIGIELTGGNENLPTSAVPAAGTLGNFPAYRRQKLIFSEARMTSTSGDNHLLTFGEYAAMYLAVWSPRVWRSLAAPDDVFVPIASAIPDLLTNFEQPTENCNGSLADWRAKAEPGFVAERTHVKLFRTLVPKVARVLANVSTYMIFDDHEVTDDWNLTLQWRRRVVTRPFGRAVMRNGMMAYTLFQAWGNDPVKFTKPSNGEGLNPADFEDEGWAKHKNGQVLKQMSAAFMGAAPFPAGGQAVIDALDLLLGLDNPDTSANAGEKATFAYTVPGPRHLVAALDTRTRRKFNGEGMAPPSLLGDTLDAQVPGGPLTDGRELLLVISAAPVLGPTLIHTIVQPLAQVFLDAKAETWDRIFDDPDPCKAPKQKIRGAESFDAEGWGTDEAALEALIRRLGTHQRVVMLSGDVHFASSAVLDFWKKGDDNAAARIVQLTSSGSRNPAPGALRAIVRAGPFFQRLLQGLPTERLAWEGESSIVVPTGQRIGPGRRARLKRKPALAPTRPWPAGTTIPADKLPDWRWRMQILRDDRTAAQLPVSYPGQPPITEFSAADPLVSYANIAARHAAAAMDRADPMRVLVFYSNVGVVTFAADGADYRLEHTLHSEGVRNSNTGAANTVHAASLSRSTEVAPQLVAGTL